MNQDRGLDALEAFRLTHGTDLAPGMAEIVRNLEMDTPGPVLRTGRRDETAVRKHHGLVLDGTEQPVRQAFGLGPGPPAVPGTAQITHPFLDGRGNFVEEQQFSVRNLEKYRIPAGERRSVRLHAVLDQHRLAPDGAPFGLAADPDTHIRAFLITAAEIGRHEVPLGGLGDRGSVTLRERSLLVEEGGFHHLLRAGQGGREMVLAGTDPQRPAAARQPDACRRARGDGHVPLHLLQVLAPARFHDPVGGLVGSVHPLQSFNGEVGLEGDAFVTGFVGAYARQFVVVPAEQAAKQHHVVAAVHRRIGRIPVPEFPDGGGAAGGHVAVAGIGILRGQQEGHVAAAHAGKLVLDPLQADHPAADMAVAVAQDLVDDVPLHRLATIGRDDVEGQCKDIGGDGIVGVVGAVRQQPLHGRGRRPGKAAFGAVQEATVEGFRSLVRLRIPVPRVLAQALQTGEFREQPGDLDIIGRGDQRPVRDAVRVRAVHQLERLRGHAPVAVAVLGDDAVRIGIAPIHIFHPFHNGSIAVADRLEVAELLPEQVAAHRQGRRPGHVVGIIIPEGRGDVRDGTVRPLGFADVPHPFGIKRVRIEKETLSQRAGHAVAQPGHALIALRAVDGHPFVVGGNPPPSIAPDGVEHLVGALEGADGFDVVVDQFRDEILRRRLFQATHFHIAEAVGGENRVPPFSSLVAGADIGIRAFGMTEIRRIQSPVGLQGLGEAQTERLAGAGVVQAHADPAGEILPEIQDPGIPVGSQAHGIEAAHHAHRGRG